ncbi:MULTISPECIES: carbohydrate-binding protein [unclassified Rhizobium]|uniref:carbohydrate-binding protein n=1 Tax=unclassified Rhizobium TaxID=2613769 RepID=UPI0011608135|nr:MULTISPECIES: carbohydrate-binding protein [unclassified Rhizobium]TQX83486.1 carbohydrate-binding protein [Rhizobium sp. rho-13.1]TQY06557.1 carbohydrate-binding protein [Rhizobium sp. rho-1.1]
MPETVSIANIDSRTIFQSPTNAFRPSAYWFWHSIPDKATCRTQLVDFQAKGIGTILIQARLALPLEAYLSSDYLVAYRDAADVASELELKLGMYDEYNWISGHAGGRTVEGRDDLRERHLFWSSALHSEGGISAIRPSFTQTMGADIIAWQYEGGCIEWRKWTIEAALLHPSATIDSLDEIVDVTSRVRITDSDPIACHYAYDGEIASGSMLTVFVSARSATSRIINYLLPEAAERFIDVGLEPLVAALGEHVPRTVQSVFYDQPAPGFYRWDEMVGNLGNSLLYAPGLRDHVEANAMAPFAHALLAVVRDVGPRTLPLRARFHAAYSALMNEAFFGTLRKWAEETRIVLTGHEVLAHVGSWAPNGGFTSIDPRVAPAVDFFGIDAFRHQTAVDANNLEPQLSAKLGDSVARSNGRSRCVVETYFSAGRTEVRAAGQWEVTREAARAGAIRLACLGARQFLWHGVYLTDGRDNDPTPFTNPRFDFAPGINFEPWWSYHDLFALEIARVSAFIEPATPRTPVAILYPLFTAFAEGPRHSHAAHIGAWCEHLLAQGCDFMFVSERDVADATFEHGCLLASGLAFDAVVLPSTTVVQSAATIERLDAFRNAGGQVWSSGERLSGVCAGQQAVGPIEASRHLEAMPDAEAMSALLSTIASSGPQIQGGKPRHWVGYDREGWWRMVVFNDGTQEMRFEIALGEGFAYQTWDPEQGAAETFAGVRRLAVLLEPHEVRCIRLCAASQAVAGSGRLSSQPPLDRSRTVALAAGWTFSAGQGQDFISISVESGWEVQGFEAFSGTGIYRLSFSVDDEGDWILELLAVHTVVTAYLDGAQVGRRGWRPYRFSLSHLAAGRHQLELHVANTAANRYYPNTPYLGSTLDKSGLSAPPRLVPLRNRPE